MDSRIMPRLSSSSFSFILRGRIFIFIFFFLFLRDFYYPECRCRFSFLFTSRALETVPWNGKQRIPRIDKEPPRLSNVQYAFLPFSHFPSFFPLFLFCSLSLPLPFSPFHFSITKLIYTASVSPRDSIKRRSLPFVNEPSSSLTRSFTPLFFQ